jgi:hypothetical protein
MTGALGDIQNQMEGSDYLKDIQSFLGTGQNAENLTASLQPQQQLETFLSGADQLQNVAQGPMSDLEQMMRQRQSELTQQATQDVASQFSGLGGLYSGAAQQAAGEEAAEAARDVGVQLGQQQIGLTGNLLQNYLNQIGQMGQAQAQTRLNAADLLRGLYGQNLQAQNQLLGQLAGFGAPTYAAPQMAYQPGFGQQMGSALANAGMMLPMMMGPESWDTGMTADQQRMARYIDQMGRTYGNPRVGYMGYL